jgi:hypothetical protein
MNNHLHQIPENAGAPTEAEIKDVEFESMERLVCMGTAPPPPAPLHQAAVFIPGNNFERIFIFYFLLKFVRVNSFCRVAFHLSGLIKLFSQTE